MDDKILWKTGPTRLMNLHYYLLVLILWGVAGLILWRYPTLDLAGRDMHLMGPAILVGLGFLLLIATEVRRATHTYLVGESTVAVKRGLVSRNLQYIPYRQIERVELDQGILGRVFNFGNLLVDTGDDNVVLRAIKGPQKGQKLIMERIVAWASQRDQAAPRQPRS